MILNYVINLQSIKLIVYLHMFNTKIIIMKLISMTDFVLEQNNEAYSKDQFIERVEAYANFLTQPLKLEMFVCSVPEPEVQGGYEKDGTFIGGYDEKWIEEYYEAKERVLFDGFEVREDRDNKWLFNDNQNKAFGWFDKDNFMFFNDFKTIEDLVKYNLTLTPNAIKQLGL